MKFRVKVHKYLYVNMVFSTIKLNSYENEQNLFRFILINNNVQSLDRRHEIHYNPLTVYCRM